jgi:hypothetical protein
VVKKTIFHQRTHTWIEQATCCNSFMVTHGM